ncbi:DUF6868 family protein [Roseibium algae]|uniref:DUF6868 family protein n=1 Tax=Roseibium algae TaxID=3123038 RepID=A0ABU8TKW7_9HYPH
MTVEQLTQFIGWCSILNLTLLLFSTFIVISCSTWIRKIHASLFDLKEQDLSNSYFRYLAIYKILIITFNLVPYISLRLIA